jgi:hypothetical protein
MRAVRDETIFNVFRKENGATKHVCGSEMSFAPTAAKQQTKRIEIRTSQTNSDMIAPTSQRDRNTSAGDRSFRS